MLNFTTSQIEFEFVTFIKFGTNREFCKLDTLAFW